MKDQKQPGKLLRQLRQKLGYTLEDWAAIFETTPTIIASIELGQEMPVEFLAKLIEWFIKTLEHPQKLTQILPHLPKKLEDWFKADYLPTDKETKELRKRVLEMVNSEINGQQQRINNYLQIISDQKEYLEEQEEQISEQKKQIANLKKVKINDKKNTRFQGILLFLIGGFLFTFTAQWLPEKSTSMEAFSMEGMIAQRDLPIPPVEKAKKAKILPPSLPKSFLVTKKHTPLAQRVMPPQKVVENKNKTALNNDLFNLLAVNGERKMPVPQRYISEKGEIILKFNNPSKQTMVVIIDNDMLEEVHNDTTKNHKYLLDISKYQTGKYFYRVYTISNIDKKIIGSFNVNSQK